MSTLSYAMILAAMSLSSNLGLLVALRQLSIPMGAFAGIVFLKESSHLPKLTGAALILAGLILMCITL